MTFIIVAAATLVVVLIHVFIGWFVANGLHRDALKVGPKADEPEVRVRDVSSDRIVLEAPEPRQDIGHPGTVGVA